MSIRVLIPDLQAPNDATHYLPSSEESYPCWVKDGYTMRIETQTKWYRDYKSNIFIKDGTALKIV